MKLSVREKEKKSQTKAWDDLEDKIKKHRWKRRIGMIVILAACAALVVAGICFRRIKTYDSYKVTDTAERDDTQSTKYAAFGNKYVKYTNDGASCINIDGDTVWSISYEMQDPIVTASDDYIAFADQGEKSIYVIDKSGNAQNYTTDMAISTISVSSGGEVAVLMQDADVGYLSVYEADGTQRAEGAIHAESSGYPMDVAISPDGEMMAVAIFLIEDGQSGTKIHFYDFDADEIDSQTAAYTYTGTIIPSLVYLEDGALAAFGDDRVIFFDDAEKPQETAEISVSSEIKSIFTGDNQIGLLLSGSEEEDGNSLQIYSSAGKELLTTDCGGYYDEAHFLNNGEIWLTGESETAIFTENGLKKYTGSAESELKLICSAGRYRKYALVYASKTNTIRLNVF